MVRALTAFDVNLLIVFLRGKEANCESHIRLSVLFQPPIGHEAGKLPPLDLAVVIQIQALDHLLDLRAKRSGSMQVSHRKAWGSDGETAMALWQATEERGHNGGGGARTPASVIGDPSCCMTDLSSLLSLRAGTRSSVRDAAHEREEGLA